jgi:hypothetical protein
MLVSIKFLASNTFNHGKEEPVPMGGPVGAHDAVWKRKKFVFWESNPDIEVVQPFA